MKLSTLRALHVATDAALVAIGWLAAWAVRSRWPSRSAARSIHSTGICARCRSWSCPGSPRAGGSGSITAGRTQTAVDELSKLLRGATLGLLVLAAVGFFFKELAFGRTVVLASAGMNLAFQAASRMFFHRVERQMRRSGSSDLRVLIVGTGVPAIRLLQKLQDHPEDGYRVVGLLTDAAELPEKDVAGQPVLGHVDDLREVAIRHGVEEILVALPSLGHTRMLSLVLACEDLGITFRVVTNLFEVLTGGYAARPRRRHAARAARPRARAPALRAVQARVRSRCARASASCSRRP
jgi:FlaA1/EpsC-like NDP-sugar epimerase